MDSVMSPYGRILARIQAGEFQADSPKTASTELQRRFRAAIRDEYGHSFNNEKTRNIFNKAWYEGKEDWVQLAQAYQKITEQDAPETILDGNLIAERIIGLADAFMKSEGFLQHPKEVRRGLLLDFVSEKVSELVQMKKVKRQVVENVLSHYESKYNVSLREMLTEEDEDEIVDMELDGDEEETPETEAPEETEASSNPVDVVKMDVPLFMRVLEFAKEEAKDDITLHRLVTNVIRMCQEGETLNMGYYEEMLKGVRGDEIDYLRALAGLKPKTEEKK